MDLLEILRRDVASLPEGPYLRGLKSVIRHIHAAESHLSRGRDQPDDAAFTDAIYRTNQAFEGSIKEAYRVLAGRDPGRTSIYSIENYLERHRIIRDRVLSQLRNYRTEWRNPATHDYNLDFDANEALLAIVSVSAFAKLLFDLIEERLTFNEVQEELEEHPPAIAPESQSVHDRVVSSIIEFSGAYLSHHALRLENEAQISGALHAFLIAVAPELNVQMEVPLGGASRRTWADFVIGSGTERVVLEVKRGHNKVLLDQAISQISLYMNLTEAASGIVFFAEPSGEFVVSNATLDSKMVTLISPRRP
jgi:hypothetical protein